MLCLKDFCLGQTGPRWVDLCFWKPQRPSGRERILGLEADQTPGKSNIPGHSEAALTGELHTSSNVTGDTDHAGGLRDARLPTQSFSHQRTTGSPGAGLQTTPPCSDWPLRNRRQRWAANCGGGGWECSHARTD